MVEGPKPFPVLRRDLRLRDGRRQEHDQRRLRSRAQRLQPAAVQPHLQQIDAPGQVNGVLADGLIRRGGRNRRHQIGHPPVELGQDGLLELTAITLFELGLDRDALVQGKPGHPPGPVLLLHLQNALPETVHRDDVGHRLPFDGWKPGELCDTVRMVPRFLTKERLSRPQRATPIRIHEVNPEISRERAPLDGPGGRREQPSVSGQDLRVEIVEEEPPAGPRQDLLLADQPQGARGNARRACPPGARC